MSLGSVVAIVRRRVSLDRGEFSNSVLVGADDVKHRGVGGPLFADRLRSSRAAGTAKSRRATNTFHRFTRRAGSDRMASLPCFALSLRGNRTARR